VSSAHVERLVRRGDLVKICGLREPAHAAVAAAAGADLIGFIFAPARRQVTARTARMAIEVARQAAADREMAAVGVFVDADAALISAVALEATLDIVQLHGQEPAEMLADLPIPAIKVLRPRPGESRDDLLATIDRYASAAVAPAAFMVEGYSETGAGGTGTLADWTLAADLARQRPFILSGGLDAGNVTRAISLVRPAGVDVSSGVEVDGAKDPDLIRRFVTASRREFLRERART
jgi:phosphoribosylanthranilate isomerase